MIYEYFLWTKIMKISKFVILEFFPYFHHGTYARVVKIGEKILDA